MPAEPEERILLGLWGVRENGAHATSGGNQAGRFVFDNLQILRFRHGGIAVVIELKHFAFRHLLAGLAEHIVNRVVTEVDDLTEGFGVEIVADEDTDLVAPDFSSGSVTSADIGFVDHIVVEQGRGMNELHQTGELVMIATGIAAETGREYKEEWSDSFSAAVQDVGGDGIDERHTGIEVRPSLAFHPFQFITVRLPDVRHGVDRGGDWSLRHAADGRAEKETKSSQSPLWGAGRHRPFGRGACPTLPS